MPPILFHPIPSFFHSAPSLFFSSFNSSLPFHGQNHGHASGSPRLLTGGDLTNDQPRSHGPLLNNLRQLSPHTPSALSYTGESTLVGGSMATLHGGRPLRPANTGYTILAPHSLT
ncbi:hypothetical protein PVAP13_8KG344701 [Panicum virgatum]|uniref:Uncharacterized protein n=1 Tax=Panicum virgatum TaxID=38727 RepID=A0A8T0PKA8_PANVG|nr:hypothetical protein PVAP13_8KG344701 [Panicum virgatum]